MAATEMTRIQQMVAQEVAGIMGREGISEREAFGKAMAALRETYPAVFAAYVRGLVSK
jgi:hypothetical protein